MALRLLTPPFEETNPFAFRDYISSRRGRVEVPETELVDAWIKAIEILDASSTAGLRAFSLYDAEYPVRLRNIPDPPAVLFVRGNPSGLAADKTVAIIGTREPTLYGVEVAARCGRSAAQAGFVVVSGLATGCDAHAHEGCLSGKGTGVAVMAHGLDKVYPAPNRKLADRLIDAGGCLVSEYTLGTKPFRTSFVERDRIQSGLSDGLLVIETDIKGGTMHTVRYAREQKRGIACISHPDHLRSHEKTRGNRMLIEEGAATPISNGDDFLLFLQKLKPGTHSVGRLPAASEEPRQQSWKF